MGGQSQTDRETDERRHPHEYGWERGGSYTTEDTNDGLIEERWRDGRMKEERKWERQTEM